MSINLKQFCADEDDFCGLDLPFNDGQYTYATNGHIGIRMDRDETNDQNVNVKAKLIKAIQQIFGDETKFSNCAPIPPYTVPEERRCQFCNGIGVYPVCPGCTGKGHVTIEDEDGDYDEECDFCEGKRTDINCHACGGTGAEHFLRVPLTDQIGIAWHYLKLIEALPDAQINLTGDPKGVVPFRLEGGIGVVMPMRA